MLLKPKGYYISEIEYNPQNKIQQNNSNEQSQSDKVLEWSREILQQPNLSVSRLLKSSCLILLNIVNQIVPCKSNEVLYTSSLQEQRKKNFDEYLETLKFIKYPKVEDINPQAFFKSDRSEIKKVIHSLSFLKKKSELKGILKETSREKRQFYLFQDEDDDEKENKKEKEKNQKIKNKHTKKKKKKKL